MAKTSKEKLVAIMGGHDWVDASVDHLIIPENIVLEDEYCKYRKWYRDFFSPIDSTVKHMSFLKWLKKAGAKEPKDTDIEEFWEPGM